MRRLIALCTMGFLLHLTVVGHDLACATHPGADSPMADGMAHGQHHGAQLPSHHGDRQHDCQTPASADCCQSMMSCAVTAIVPSRAPVAAFANDAGIVAYRSSELPALRGAPPTPPPRA